MSPGSIVFSFHGFEIEGSGGPMSAGRKTCTPAGHTVAAPSAPIVSFRCDFCLIPVRPAKRGSPPTGQPR